MAAWVDEVSFLNVSTFGIFALMVALAAHEEHVEAFALLPDRARSTTVTSLQQEATRECNPSFGLAERRRASTSGTVRVQFVFGEAPQQDIEDVRFV